MKPEVKSWLEEDGEGILQSIGIKEAQVILDFGCGPGLYTTLAARIVGEKGRVYALDKNKEILDKLRQKAKRTGLENIEIIETKGEIEIPLEERSVDVALLYDVLHSYYFSLSGRKGLLAEVWRVLKFDGLVSVYPKHMSPEEVIKEVEEVGFNFEEKFHKRFLVHNNTLEEGVLLNFRKGG